MAFHMNILEEVFPHALEAYLALGDEHILGDESDEDLNSLFPDFDELSNTENAPVSPPVDPQDILPASYKAHEAETSVEQTTAAVNSPTCRSTVRGSSLIETKQDEDDIATLSCYESDQHMSDDAPSNPLQPCPVSVPGKRAVSSSASLPLPSSIARTAKPSTTPAQQTAGPPSIHHPQTADTNADPYETATFPPGGKSAGFIPFGDPRIASHAQGNYWPIDIALRDEILVAEVDGRELRGTRLGYEEVLSKYTAWQGKVSASTLRGRKRKIIVPVEHRGRVVAFEPTHLRALRAAVPLATSSRGIVSWTRVREVVIERTGRPFGKGTLRKKWEQRAEWLQALV